jgi:hypothetical protein
MTTAASPQARHHVLVVDDEIKVAELFLAVLKSRHDSDIALYVSKAEGKNRITAR